MTKKIKRRYLWVFWLELTLAAVIPFIIMSSNTPTNVINSNSLFKLLDTIGTSASTLIFFIGIPAGIIGIVLSRRLEKLRIATIILSGLNLTAGLIEIIALILIFCMTVFGGASV